MDINYNNSSSVQLNNYLNNIKKINLFFSKSFENKLKFSKNNNNNEKTKFKILDIGCSHGKNSNIQINQFLNQIKLNKEISDTKSIEIQVYHADIPENDFTKLFKLLNNNENSYLNQQQEGKEGEMKIYSYGIGNTFYNQILPNNSCDFIFSFFTFHWVPMIDEYKSYDRSLLDGKYSSRFENLNDCKERLTRIFTNRANELKKGGIFICNFVITDQETEEICDSTTHAFQEIKNVAREMHNDGILTRDEVSKMVLPLMISNNHEIDFAIKQVESSNTGLKLLEKSKSLLNWKQHVLSTPSGSASMVDEIQTAHTIVESILSFSGGIIHSSFSGDQSRKDSLYDEFKSRLLEKYKSSPTSFDFTILVLFLSFEKIN